MKGECEPVTLDEAVVRLVWKFHYKPASVLPIRFDAFEPKGNETEGISVYRAACLSSPDHALQAMPAGNRGSYAVALLPVAEIVALGLTVRPAPIAAVPGHAVIPELNALEYRADKDRLRAIMRKVAEIAAGNIVRMPAD